MPSFVETLTCLSRSTTRIARSSRCSPPSRATITDTTACGSGWTTVYDSEVELISDPRLIALGFERVYRGREERIRFQERWAAEWGDLQFAPEELVDLGDGRLAWSVTGAIAFARPDGYMYVMNPDGSGLRQLSSIPCSQPDWSPDGRR